MSDTQPAAEATNNPAELPKSEDSVEIKHDHKTAGSPRVAEANSIERAQSDDKETTNGAQEAVKSMEPIVEKDKKGSGPNGRKHDRDDRRNGGRFNNRKSKTHNDEFDNLPETDDPDEIRTQVEFYFSVQNLRTDRHMFLELDGPKNRPVSIKHISQFKRMRHFQPYSAIVKALRESEYLIVVDDGEYSGTGNEAVKRKEPLEVPREDDDDADPPTTVTLFDRMYRAAVNNLENSVYVKGFAPNGEKIGQIALEQFFRPFGAVMVRKRTDEDMSWKGSVFVEFDNAESTRQFLSMDPKPQFNGNDLFIMSKKAYSEMKCEQKGIIPAWKEGGKHTSARSGHRGGFQDRGRSRGRGRGGRGGRGGGRDFSRRRDDHQNSRGNANGDSKKRKVEAFEDDGSPKRSKIEIKHDE